MSQSAPISINPKVLGGTPVFSGTRVPVKSLFDHLKRGYSVDEFLADFPTVKRELVAGVLELAEADADSKSE